MKDLLDAFEVNNLTLLQKSGGSAALLSLFDGLDLLDPFEVKNISLLQKDLKDLVRQRGLGVQQNLRLDLLDAFEEREIIYFRFKRRFFLHL